MFSLRVKVTCSVKSTDLKKDWVEQPIVLLHQHDEADRVSPFRDLWRLKL